MDEEVLRKVFTELDYLVAVNRDLTAQVKNAQLRVQIVNTLNRKEEVVWWGINLLNFLSFPSSEICFFTPVRLCSCFQYCVPILTQRKHVSSVNHNENGEAVTAFCKSIGFLCQCV